MDFQYLATTSCDIWCDYLPHTNGADQLVCYPPLFKAQNAANSKLKQGGSQLSDRIQ